MKTKKVYIIILIFCCLILCSNKCNKNSSNIEKYNHLTNEISDKVSINDDVQIKANTIIKNVESDLQKKGSSVVGELTRLKHLYRNKYNNEKNATNNESERLNNILCQIKQLEIMIEEYNALDYNSLSKKISNRYMLNNQNNINNLSPFYYAHSAVVAELSSRGYILSSELLTYMRDNSVKDSVYRPINSSIVRNSLVFNNLAYNSSLSGNSIFPSGSDTVSGQDLHLSINRFNYNKPINNTAIVLTDRYDFDCSEQYVELEVMVGNDMMYLAQNVGYLTPFFVIVEAENYVNVTNYNNYSSFPYENDRYSDVVATIGRMERMTFSITFDTSGYRNVQTFGYNDAGLRIKNVNGDIIAYDDDNGYDNNAFIRFYFVADISYDICVLFANVETKGNVKVAITSSDYYSYNGIEELCRTQSGSSLIYEDKFVCNYDLSEKMFLLRPLNDRSFEIKTNIIDYDDYCDTFLYFIDPRRADNYSYVIDEIDNLHSYYHDDDSGGDLQAKIIVNVHAVGIPYLIIAATFDCLEGCFYLSIDGLDN